MGLISLLWKKPGTRNIEVFDPDYGKQYLPMTGFAYGVNNGSTTLKFNDALSKLMEPIWDGKPFGDVIPTLPDLPERYIVIDVPQNKYPENIPPFRDYDPNWPNYWYMAYNQNEDKNGGHKWYYLYARNQNDLMIWDYFGITHWEDPRISDDDTTWIDNPEYAPALAEQNRLIDEYKTNFFKKWDNGCQLTLIARVIFPVIPDDPGTRWFLVEGYDPYWNAGGTQTEIPVEVGKYSIDKKFRYRKVLDLQSNDVPNIINRIINDTIFYKKLYGVEKSLQYMVGLVATWME